MSEKVRGTWNRASLFDDGTARRYNQSCVRSQRRPAKLTVSKGRGKRQARPQSCCNVLFWTAPLLVAFGILAGINVIAPVSAKAAKLQGRIDVYWSHCDYFDCTCEPRTPYLRDPLELDIHADGYSLRLRPADSDRFAEASRLD